MTPAAAGDKGADRRRLKALAEEIGDLQNRLYAERSRALLVILQGMDASGKDGTTNAVFGRTQPLGLRAVAFKAPTAEERARDFLWRVHAQVPPKGVIGVFNRSHYEDVVTAAVRGLIDAPERERRYAHVNAFERLLVETGTWVVKCFLHLSPGVQKTRLEARLHEPHKQWKFDPQDLTERVRWDDNLAAYDRALWATSTAIAPWWVVPADAKSHRNLMAAELVCRALRQMAPQYPALPAAYADLRVE